MPTTVTPTPGIDSQTSNGQNGQDSGAATNYKTPDIEQDIKEMSRRKRVEMIMNSQLFREELERIIENQFSVGGNGMGPLAGLSALQQVTDLLAGRGYQSLPSSTFRLGPSIIPINDIRGIDVLRYEKGEPQLRCKVAAVYRLIELNGWSQSIYNHITARISQEEEHFLINPFGLQYDEVTASSLLKIDMQGKVIHNGSTNFIFNRAGFNLHSAIHMARPDIKAIIHIHYPPCVAVSAFKQGLLPLCQEAAIVGNVSYYDYTGILVDSDERDAIGRELGVHNKVMILRNHGVVACGVNIEEALFYLHNIVKACETQVKLLSVGIENLTLMSPEAIESTQKTVKTSAVQGRDGDASELTGNQKVAGSQQHVVRNIKELEFEAQMRRLDNAGLRTGYVYKQPLIRREERLKHDVEEPPTATSFQQQTSSYLDEDKWLSPLKKLVDGKKSYDRTRWVNSPNVYQKREVLETGTPEPKTITRWISPVEAPSNGTGVQVKPHQFAPPNTGMVDEFKRKQREMKDLRMKNLVSSGPQSQILDGVTWDELHHGQMVGGAHGESGKSGVGIGESEQTVIVGAASRGIIQRDHQLNAQVYKSPYVKNPFDNISDAELEEYKRLVARKQRGEEVPYEEIPENMRHLLNEPIGTITHQSMAGRGDTLDSMASPTSPLSEDESDRKSSSLKDGKSKDKKKRIRTPSFLKGGRKDKDEDREKEKEREKAQSDAEKKEKEKEKDKEKRKDKKKREKERA